MKNRMTLTIDPAVARRARKAARAKKGFVALPGGSSRRPAGAPLTDCYMRIMAWMIPCAPSLRIPLVRLPPIDLKQVACPMMLREWLLDKSQVQQQLELLSTASDMLICGIT